MAEKKPKGWIPKAEFHPGGSKGKLHRELGVPEGQKIPQSRLAAAAGSSNPAIRRDAARAKTMASWHHGGFYDHPSSKASR